MKTILRAGLISLLIALVVLPVLADNAGIYTVQCERGFMLQSVDATEDGTFLFAGLSDIRGAAAEIMSVGGDGKIIWSRKHEGLEGFNVYRDAEYLDQDTIVALRSNDLDDTSGSWLFEIINNRDVVFQSEPIIHASGIHCVSDGFFVLSRPGDQLSRIEKYDTAGTSLWKIEWKERLSFTGIVSQGDRHIAYGSKTIMENDWESGPTSVVVAFDDHGNILWRHDSESYEGYSDAVLTDDHLVLIGNTVPQSRLENPDPNRDNLEHGFVTEYTEQGCVWRLDSTYVLPDEDYAMDTQMTSVVAVDDGYLVSQVANYKVRLLLADADGNLVEEWEEDTSGVLGLSFASLFKTNDKIYLIAVGQDGSVVDFYEDKDSLSPGNIVTIREISISE